MIVPSLLCLFFFFLIAFDPAFVLDLSRVLESNVFFLKSLTMQVHLFCVEMVKCTVFCIIIIITIIVDVVNAYHLLIDETCAVVGEMIFSWSYLVPHLSRPLA